MITQTQLLTLNLVTTACTSLQHLQPPTTTYNFHYNAIMAVWPATAFTPDRFNIPTSDGDIIEFTGAYSEWDLFRDTDGRLVHGDDVSIIKEMMDAAEEERNKELKRKTRIIGEALDALTNFSEFKHAKWFGRGDSWTRTYAGPNNDPEWPEYRTFAHFMLWPLEGEIPEALDRAEEDADYEAWTTSKQYVKSLEEHNRHKLLAYEKGQSPQWAGECTGDCATTTVITAEVCARSDTLVPTERCVLYNTFLKDRYRVDAVIRTEFPEKWGSKGYAKASSAFGDIYIPEKFRGYIGQPGSPQLMTVALQDVGGRAKKGNGFRWTCIYTH